MDLRGGSDGFEFLAFHLRLVKAQKYGQWYCQLWLVGEKAAGAG